MGTNRTECIFLHVSPEIKAKLENCATDEKMQEQIIREYIEREKNWMNDSLEQLEKEELIYKCSLIKIKDSFGKAQDAYADEIAKLIDVSLNKNNELRVEIGRAHV